jgi:RNA polymerase sigma-70 factor, ECF subfamily
MAVIRLVAAPSSGHGLQSRSDDELMTLAQGGRTDAFAALVTRHGARVITTCSRFVANAELGAELAQDTWVLAWERRSAYQAGGELLPWLITVARNRCRNHLRGQAVEQRYQAEQEPETALAPEQIDALLSAEQQRRVRDALQRLPVAMREVLLLRYGEELRYDAIASVLGDSESTLRSRVYYGLKSLRLELEKKR